MFNQSSVPAGFTADSSVNGKFIMSHSEQNDTPENAYRYAEHNHTVRQDSRIEFKNIEISSSVISESGDPTFVNISSSSHKHYIDGLLKNENMVPEYFTLRFAEPDTDLFNEIPTSALIFSTGVPPLGWEVFHSDEIEGKFILPGITNFQFGGFKAHVHTVEILQDTLSSKNDFVEIVEYSEGDENVHSLPEHHHESEFNDMIESEAPNDLPNISLMLIHRKYEKFSTQFSDVKILKACNETHFHGTYCGEEYPICNGVSSYDENVCSGHGKCYYRGSCVCDDGFHSTLDGNCVDSTTDEYKDGVKIIMYSDKNCDSVEIGSLWVKLDTYIDVSSSLVEENFCYGRNYFLATKSYNLCESLEEMDSSCEDDKNMMIVRIFCCEEKVSSTCDVENSYFEKCSLTRETGYYQNRYSHSKVEITTKDQVQIELLRDNFFLTIRESSCGNGDIIQWLSLSNIYYVQVDDLEFLGVASENGISVTNRCLNETHYLEETFDLQNFFELEGTFDTVEIESCDVNRETVVCGIGWFCHGYHSSSALVCSNRGDCVEKDTCKCSFGFYGEKCEKTDCNGLLSTDPLSCGEGGLCIGKNICMCKKGMVPTKDGECIDAIHQENLMSGMIGYYHFYHCNHFRNGEFDYSRENTCGSTGWENCMSVRFIHLDYFQGYVIYHDSEDCDSTSLNFTFQGLYSDMKYSETYCYLFEENWGGGKFFDRHGSTKIDEVGENEHSLLFYGYKKSEFFSSSSDDVEPGFIEIQYFLEDSECKTENINSAKRKQLVSTNQLGENSLQKFLIDNNAFFCNEDDQLVTVVKNYEDYVSAVDYADGYEISSDECIEYSTLDNELQGALQTYLDMLSYKYIKLVCKEHKSCGGYEGYDFDNVCSTNGDCVNDDKCNCHYKFGGDNCETYCPENEYDPNCESYSDTISCVNGNFNDQQKVCVCDMFHTGRYCDIELLRCGDYLSTQFNDVCSGVGVCVEKDSCLCNEGYVPTKTGLCVEKDEKTDGEGVRIRYYRDKNCLLDEIGTIWMRLNVFISGDIDWLTAYDIDKYYLFTKLLDYGKGEFTKIAMFECLEKDIYSCNFFEGKYEELTLENGCEYDYNQVTPLMVVYTRYVIDLDEEPEDINSLIKQNYMITGIRKNNTGESILYHYCQLSEEKYCTNQNLYLFGRLNTLMFNYRCLNSTHFGALQYQESVYDCYGKSEITSISSANIVDEKGQFSLCGDVITCNGVLSSDFDVCSSTGVCGSDDDCECGDGISGKNCELFSCDGKLFNDTNSCSGLGKCLWRDSCVCKFGYRNYQGTCLDPSSNSDLFPSASGLFFRYYGTDSKCESESYTNEFQYFGEDICWNSTAWLGEEWKSVRMFFGYKEFRYNSNTIRGDMIFFSESECSPESEITTMPVYSGTDFCTLINENNFVGINNLERDIKKSDFVVKSLQEVDPGFMHISKYHYDGSCDEYDDPTAYDVFRIEHCSNLNEWSYSGKYHIICDEDTEKAYFFDHDNIPYNKTDICSDDIESLADITVDINSKKCLDFTDEIKIYFEDNYDFIVEKKISFLCKELTTCHGIVSTSKNVCSKNGNCLAKDECDCDPGWVDGHDCSNFTCELISCTSEDEERNGVTGFCSGPNECTCYEGWRFDECNTFECTWNTCSGKGICNGPNSCRCESGWSGEKCDDFVCEIVICDEEGGYCSGPNECSCNIGYRGDRCENFECVNSTADCGEYGTCVNVNECECDNGWRDSSKEGSKKCTEFYCDFEEGCGEHGNCTDANTCTCLEGWTTDIPENPCQKRSLVFNISLFLEYSGIISGIVIGILGCFIIIGITIAIIVRISKKRKNRKVFDESAVPILEEHEKKKKRYSSSEIDEITVKINKQARKIKEHVEVRELKEIENSCIKLYSELRRIGTQFKEPGVAATHLAKAIKEEVFVLLNEKCIVVLLRLFEFLLELIILKFSGNVMQFTFYDGIRDVINVVKENTKKKSEKKDEDFSLQILFLCDCVIEGIKNLNKKEDSIKSSVKVIFNCVKDYSNIEELVIKFKDNFHRIPRDWYPKYIAFQVLSLDCYNNENAKPMELLLENFPKPEMCNDWRLLVGCCLILFDIFVLTQNNEIRKKSFFGISGSNEDVCYPSLLTLFTLFRTKTRKIGVCVRSEMVIIIKKILALIKDNGESVKIEESDLMFESIQKAIVFSSITETDTKIKKEIAELMSSIVGEKFTTFLKIEQKSIVKYLDKTYIELSNESMLVEKRFEELSEKAEKIRNLKEDNKLRKEKFEAENSLLKKLQNEKEKNVEELRILNKNFLLLDEYSKKKSKVEERKEKQMREERMKLETEINKTEFEEKRIFSLKEKLNAGQQNIEKLSLELQEEVQLVEEEKVQYEEKIKSYEQQKENFDQIRRDYDLAMELHEEQIIEKNRRVEEGAEKNVVEINENDFQPQIQSGEEFGNLEVPPDYKCPISLEIMNDPVLLAESGNTYERSEIQTWLEENDSDPLSGIKLQSKLIIPNLTLKRGIAFWKENNKK